MGMNLTPVPWGERQTWGAPLNPHFTKEVLLHERERYLQILQSPGITLLGFLQQIGVVPEHQKGEPPPLGVAPVLEEWPVDQQQEVIAAVIWAIKNHSGIVFSYWGRSTEYQIVFPLAWDGDYLPIMFVQGAEPKPRKAPKRR